MKYEKEFRKAHPETIGETDREFDLLNYTEWLEGYVEHYHQQKIEEPMPDGEEILALILCNIKLEKHRIVGLENAVNSIVIYIKSLLKQEEE